jgi:hypothetical protein
LEPGRDGREERRRVRLEIEREQQPLRSPAVAAGKSEEFTPVDDDQRNVPLRSQAVVAGKSGDVLTERDTQPVAVTEPGEE